METRTDSTADSYGQIGQLLRSARMQMQVPIEQASYILHIRVRYLMALEEGRLQELPGLTYTRGYLQSYAVFLGLDKDEIMRRFEEVADMLARRNFYFPQVFSKDKTPSPTVVWGSLALAVAVYFLWVLLFHASPGRISQVQPFPESRAKVQVSIETVKDVACLRVPVVLYPPCTMAKEPVFDLIPLNGQRTVMELAGPESSSTP